MPSPNINLRALILPASAFLFGLISLGLAALWTFAPSPQEAQTSSVGGPFELTAMDGARVSSRQFEGAPMLVFFGFTHCPDICPTKLMEVSEIFRAAGNKAANVRALFITVDPARDTPEVLKSYLGSFDPRIIGLTGSQDEIDRAVKAYRAYAKRVPTSSGDYTMDHTAIVYLMDRRGRFVGSFNTERSPEDAARELLRHL
ncbi:MAG: SCO family protein [Beijerinckiaceae bacterium]|jgi:protein SCO1/2|nr:SCO family protein [Beijerinckiaceae bacterium]